MRTRPSQRRPTRCRVTLVQHGCLVSRELGVIGDDVAVEGVDADPTVEDDHLELATTKRYATD
jgi:hypothetical protein